MEFSWFAFEFRANSFSCSISSTFTVLSNSISSRNHYFAVILHVVTSVIFNESNDKWLILPRSTFEFRANSSSSSSSSISTVLGNSGQTSISSTIRCDIIRGDTSLYKIFFFFFLFFFTKLTTDESDFRYVTGEITVKRLDIKGNYANEALRMNETRKIFIYYMINFLVARDDAFSGCFSIQFPFFIPAPFLFLCVLGEGDDEWTNTLLHAYVTLSIIPGSFFVRKNVLLPA